MQVSWLHQVWRLPIHAFFDHECSSITAPCYCAVRTVHTHASVPQGTNVGLAP